MLQTKFPGIDCHSTGLGFGCMRLPFSGEEKNVDEAEAIRMIRYAIDNGVKYIDTAYPYHGGMSEVIVGKALQDGYREKIVLATKLPVWKVETHEDMMKLLDEQLSKLQTDHVDFYLMHAMGKERLEKMQKLDYRSFLDEAVAEGKIRFPAFSFHDNYDTFMEILQDYPWKMCQVQMNLLDGDTQATLQGIHEAGKRGIGVVVMEPLRGGLLANPPEDVSKVYADFPEKRSCVEWAFRYLYSMPEVVTILSGMSSMEQLQDNLRIFSTPDAEERKPLSDSEKELFSEVKETYMKRTKTRCTGCRYCQPCPRGVTIPVIFQNYDEIMLKGKGDIKAEYAKVVEAGGDASRCVGCHACEKQCPQHLPIIRFLKEIHAECTAE